jgi:branched-chain amino acid transport system ATP-binding protein
MARPRLLLLDEPSLGLAPLIVNEIFQIIRSINADDQTTLLIVEQNAQMALGIADYGYVLQVGKVAASGPAQELRQNEDVIRSYMGRQK